MNIPALNEIETTPLKKSTHDIDQMRLAFALTLAITHVLQQNKAPRPGRNAPGQGSFLKLSIKAYF
jgi:hypothetical protein